MTQTQAARATQVRWRILAVMVWAGLVSYLLRGNLSIAAPTMMAELQISEIQWGWVMAAFPLGYALFQFPGGLWVGRIGPRRALMLIALAWTGLILLSCLIPSRNLASLSWLLGALILVQFLVGVAHAPIFPAVAKGIERWFPAGQWALPNGLSSAGLSMGLAATAALLPWLISMLDWRLAFAALAPAGLLSAGLSWWYLRDSATAHPAVNQAELELIARGRAYTAAAQTSAAPDALSREPLWLRLLKDRNLLLIMLSYSCMNFVFYVVFTWGYYYLVNVRGFAAQEAGFLTSLQWLGAGIGAVLGGWICDRLCRQIGIRWGCRATIVFGMVGSAILLLGVAYHPNAYAAAVMLGACFFFNQATEGPYWAASTAIGGRHAGAATGLMNMGANLMGFINALLLSWVAERLGWPTAIGIGAAFALAGAALVLMARADQEVAQDR